MGAPGSLLFLAKMVFAPWPSYLECKVCPELRSLEMVADSSCFLINGSYLKVFQ